MNQTPKTFAPVTEFELETGYCPLYLALGVLDEVRDHFRIHLPESYADNLAQRAEAVFAHHPVWQRRFKSRRGREFILASMRHWLAGLLALHQPGLFDALPDNFKVGLPLPVNARDQH